MGQPAGESRLPHLQKMKIGDIALELGYSNASKFAKAFQSVYGMLPKDYRKNK